MQAVQDALNSVLEELPSLAYRDSLEEYVASVLTSLDQKTPPEIRKTQWEFVLRQEVFALAATEGQALTDTSTVYYDDLTRRLDLVLAFTANDACDQIFPFNMLYDLLETQTIASCSHIFSWIELRADKLTEGMIPQKGKALVLLRTLNDLLRRLSKMGSTTLFCGRILTFLSQVFPLGERSGVNLRGEYGPAWDGPGLDIWSPDSNKEDKQDIVMEEKPRETTDAMQVDDGSKTEVKADEETKDVADAKQQQKDEFYRTFWSLQLPFSKPWVFAQVTSMAKFREFVSKVLPLIKEATAKERALMGSKANSNAPSLKRRREPEVGLETAGQDYFFAKYLTSPDLIDLEVADTHFRRQFLFQLLILLHHLLTFTAPVKGTWVTSRNRSLQIDFVLDADDAQWAQETIAKVSEELRATTPSGRAFAETVHVILEREKNWVKWKNELCAPFDKVPWAEEIEVELGGMITKTKASVEEATRDARKRRRQDPADWPYELGTESLTEIWAMGYRDLTDLEHPFHPGDVQDFVKKIKIEDAKIEQRKKQLARTADRMAQARAKAAVAASAAASPAPPASIQENVTPINVAGPRATVPATAPTATATALLHPSLPAKPGTAPSRPPPPPDPIPTPAPAPVVLALAAPIPTPAVVPPPVLEVITPPDNMIMQYEENKQRWSWLALRTARDQYLQHFGKIGTGDVLLLAQEIEKEKAEKEQVLRGEAPSTDNKDERGTSPMVGSVISAGQAGDIKADGTVEVGEPEEASGAAESESKEVTAGIKDNEVDVQMEA